MEKDRRSELQPDHPSSPDVYADEKNGTNSKLQQIETACQEKDFDALAELAKSENGFVNNETRKIAWATLIGTDVGASGKNVISRPKINSHPDEGQVKLDVDRAFVNYPTVDNEKQQVRLKTELFDLITQVLRRHPELCYFQGYHDIVQVFLLTLGGEESTVRVVERLSILRLRDFMHDSIAPAITHLRLLPAVLRVADAELAKHLANTQPFFALAPTLTLYAHVIQEYGDIARLFDFLLSHGAAMSIYLFAIIICARKKELLEFEPEESDILHSILSKLPQPLDLEALISKAVALYQQCPPEELPRKLWCQVSAYSSLKTTNDARALSQQTLQDGEHFFAKHARMIKISQGLSAIKLRIWRMRKPTGYVAMTVTVALLAWWLRGNSTNGLLNMYWQSFTKYSSKFISKF